MARKSQKTTVEKITNVEGLIKTKEKELSDLKVKPRTLVTLVMS